MQGPEITDLVCGAVAHASLGIGCVLHSAPCEHAAREVGLPRGQNCSSWAHGLPAEATAVTRSAPQGSYKLEQLRGVGWGVGMEVGGSVLCCFQHCLFECRNAM